MSTIDKIILHIGVMPADLEFSYGSGTSVSFCVVEICAGGIIGLGECLAPNRRYCEEMGRALLGRDAMRLDALIPREPFAWQRSVQRELFSMALHDLVGRHLGAPLHVMMGGKRRDRIRMMPCVFPHSPEDAGDKARKFADQGFTALKVKIFGKPKLDLGIISEVRRAFPEGFLQADANCGYKGFDATRDILPALFKEGLDAAEDPGDMPLTEYLDLMALPERPKIILDAPTRGDLAIAEAARLKCCDAVNLHPNMQGTFSDIRDRAAVIRMAGLEVEVGGTGYTGVGAFAHLHVASVYGENYPYGEIGGWLDHGEPESTASDGLPIVEGFAEAPGTPGHGGELNREVLMRRADAVKLSL